MHRSKPKRLSTASIRTPYSNHTAARNPHHTWPAKEQTPIGIPKSLLERRHRQATYTWNRMLISQSGLESWRTAKLRLKSRKDFRANTRRVTFSCSLGENNSPKSRHTCPRSCKRIWIWPEEYRQLTQYRGKRPCKLKCSRAWTWPTVRWWSI